MTEGIARAGQRRRSLLARVLDEPDVVTLVRTLDARDLGALIRHVGLEDAGEIVALATSEQIVKVLDEDLWRSERPGEDEAFDAQRFELWLTVLLEAGEDELAARVTALPEELVFLGMHRLVLVLDLEAVGDEVRALDEREGDLVEKALEGCYGEELEGFRIVSRRPDGWDAIWTLLLALDKTHHEYLARLLERLCAASSDIIEESGGLYHALSSAETLASDAEADREDRRAAQGYVAAASARSFLALARTTDVDAVLAEVRRDPVTSAYFRELDRSAHVAKSTKDVAPARPLAALLGEIGAPVAEQRALPAALALEGAPSRSRFRDALHQLAAHDALAHGRRVEELAYLVQVLMAGGVHEGRAYTPLAATEAVVAACEVGLARASSRIAEDVNVLADRTADQLFRIGWKITQSMPGGNSESK